MTASPGRASRVGAWGVGVGVPVAVAVAGVGVWGARWSQLPEPVATHWSGWGAPDGHMTRVAAMAVSGGVPLAAAVGLVVAVAAGWRARVPWPGLLGFLAIMLGGMSIVVVLANDGAANWRDADLPAAALIIALVGSIIVAGFSARALVGLTGPWRPTAPGAEPALRLRGDERAAWTGGCRWPGARTAAAVVALAALVATPIVSRPPVIGLAAVAGLVALLSSVRVSAGQHGLRVRPGLVPWPAVVLPLDRIERVAAIDVRPLQWGGWGYRGSLRLLRRAAWVVRRGPGLRVDLRDGGVFVVTVDDPEGAAAVLNGLLARGPA